MYENRGRNREINGEFVLTLGGAFTQDFRVRWRHVHKLYFELQDMRRLHHIEDSSEDEQQQDNRNHNTDGESEDNVQITEVLVLVHYYIS